MWSRLREAVAGIARQAGIEVPGLDAGVAAVTGLAGSAADVASAVVPDDGASDVVATATDLAGSAANGELAAGAADAAAAGAGDAVTGVVDQVTTTAAGLLETFKGGVAG